MEENDSIATTASARRRLQNNGVWNTGWTGPDDDDLDASGVRLLRPVPPERWPYGPPDDHEICCVLHVEGLFCDCKASDESDEEYGNSA